MSSIDSTKTKEPRLQGFGLVVWLFLFVGLGGCAARQQYSLPDKEFIARDQLLLHTDFHLPTNHRLVEDITSLRFDIAERMRLPLSEEPIHVYLFENSAEYRLYMQAAYPGLPYRRAFFQKSDTTLSVFAHWGERVAEDLRHETTHAYLHSSIPNLPLWIDEGFAEYFEVGRGRHGVNETHVRLLRDKLAKGEWRPDLPRLEKLELMEEMGQVEYAEAWLWVHFLFETEPYRVEFAREIARELRLSGESPNLSEYFARTGGIPNEEIVRHLQGIRLPGE